MVRITNSCFSSYINYWPKNFPVVLRKLGSWIGSTKKYFSDMQNKINQTVDEENSVEKNYSKTSNDKKDE